MGKSSEFKCPCCNDEEKPDDFINFTSNSGNSFVDLQQLRFNDETKGLPYSASFGYNMVPDHKIDTSDWELINDHTGYYSTDLITNPAGSRTQLFTKDGAWLQLEITQDTRDDRPTMVEIAVVSPRDECYEIIKDFVGDSVWVEEQAEDSREVKIGFWSMSQMGPQLRRKRIVAQFWDEISHNYSASLNEGLGKLMQLTPDTMFGKMVLLHGAPGTGKTSSLRTLALSWKEWCDLEVVVDPEQLFTNSDYLMTVLQERRSSDRWTFLLLEDCDELISQNANMSGQVFSRLLNATDGFLGHGLNLLVGITTNEPIDSLHAAVLRSGRCLAKLEVPPLTKDEAIRWLGEEPELISKIKGDTTLADLYALKNERAVISDVKPEVQAPGQYI